MGAEPGASGTIGSAAFVGMAIGAVAIGRVSDRVGRKAAVLGSVCVFSLATVLCAAAPNPLVFAVLRLVAGMGLGGLVPSVNAMVADLVPARRMAAWSTVMMSGVPLGGTLAAVLAGVIVPSDPHWGWRTMYLLGVIPLVCGLPVAWKVLPAGARTASDAPSAEPSGFHLLLGKQYRGMTAWFTAASFATLLAWFGLGTWLPKLMTESGYDFGAALHFTLALNLGAIAGSVATAWAGDRFGPVRAGSGAAAAAAVALALLLTGPGSGVVFIILVLAGVGTHGTQILIIAGVARMYPDQVRGTALGWTSGVGRIGAVLAPQMAGLLLAAGLGVGSNYLMFASAAGVSAASLLVLTMLYLPRVSAKI